MPGVKLFQRIGIGCVAVAASLFVVPSAGAKAIPKSHSYEIKSAFLKVNDVASETTNFGASWNGSGHHLESLQEPAGQGQDDLPLLPVGLIAGKKNSVTVLTDQIRDGNETLIDAAGMKDECSGEWEEQTDNSFSVAIKESGKKINSKWEFPTGVASENCGFLYDQFKSPFKVNGSDAGEIGDKRITLSANGTKAETETTSTFTIEQTITYKGKVVLEKVKTQGPSFPGG